MPDRVDEALDVAQRIAQLRAEGDRLRAQQAEIARLLGENADEIARQLAQFKEYVQGKSAAVTWRVRVPRTEGHGSAIDRIRAILTGMPGAKLTVEEIGQKLKAEGADIDTATLRSTLIRLHKNGEIERPARGVYFARAEPAGLNGAVHAEEAEEAPHH